MLAKQKILVFIYHSYSVLGSTDGWNDVAGRKNNNNERRNNDDNDKLMNKWITKGKKYIQISKWMNEWKME